MAEYKAEIINGELVVIPKKTRDEKGNLTIKIPSLNKQYEALYEWQLKNSKKYKVKIHGKRDIQQIQSKLNE